jgi:hypothetical protein
MNYRSEDSLMAGNSARPSTGKDMRSQCRRMLFRQRLLSDESDDAI